jgi:CheY-like chemotaxis protein
MEKKTILCVDDERIILSSLKSQLRSALGDITTIESAESPAEGLEIVEDYAQEGGIHIIVSDWLMPKMRGDEFLIKVHQKYPNIINIILTGQADDIAIQNAYNKANLYKCLPKPWDREQLLDTLREGLACA